MIKRGGCLKVGVSRDAQAATSTLLTQQLLSWGGACLPWDLQEARPWGSWVGGEKEVGLVCCIICVRLEHAS